MSTIGKDNWQLNRVLGWLVELTVSQSELETRSLIRIYSTSHYYQKTGFWWREREELVLF